MNEKHTEEYKKALSSIVRKIVDSLPGPKVENKDD